MLVANNDVPNGFGVAECSPSSWEGASHHFLQDSQAMNTDVDEKTKLEEWRRSYAKCIDNVG